MSGWFRCEIDGHERRRVYMREHGLALDRDSAIDDLRAFQNRAMAPGASVRFPSSKEFAERWGWPKTTAYRLVSRPELWSDPSRLDAWKAMWNDRGTIVEREWNDGGTSGHDTTPITNETRNASGTRVEREWNESGHTRVVVQTQTQTQTPLQEQEVAPPALLLLGRTGAPTKPKSQPVDLDALAGWWNDAVVPEARRNGGRPPTYRAGRLPKDVRKVVAAAIRDHDEPREALERVCRWYAASGHATAVHNRTEGYGLDTLARHLGRNDLLALAEIEHGPCRPSSARPADSARAALHDLAHDLLTSPALEARRALTSD